MRLIDRKSAYRYNEHTDRVRKEKNENEIDSEYFEESV